MNSNGENGSAAQPRPLSRRRAAISLKRSVDVIGASLGLVVFAPVMAMVALVVRVRLGSPVLFRQHRPGLDGTPFELLKFRTMRDGEGSDDERLTAFGRRLRSWSLDELPELLNVLRGEMSLVGPRPLLVEYLPRYSDRQRRRHEVRPGLTGLAQVEGRNLLSWQDRLELDVVYVETQSLRMDLRIIAWTIVHVIRRHGTTTLDGSIMPEFTGESHR